MAIGAASASMVSVVSISYHPSPTFCTVLQKGSTWLPPLSYPTAHGASSAARGTTLRKPLALERRRAQKARAAANEGAAVQAHAAQSADAVVQPGGQATGGVPPGEMQPVLVVGATGGVGQLCAARLLERGCRVLALTRSREKVEAIFGSGRENLQVIVADIRDPGSLNAPLIKDAKSAIICTGTTAFPSKRWQGNNGPEQTDVVGVRNMLAALPVESVRRVVFISSAGVERFNQLPFNILNLFGVLRCKKAGEDLVRACGAPYTIIRAGRLTDGPYTSYDLNTLLRATAGLRRDVVISKADDLNGEASRISVAEAAIQSLCLSVTENGAFLVNSTEGEGPGTDESKWEAAFKGASSSAA